MNFIDEKVVIDFPLPASLKSLAEECEIHDKEDNYGAYEEKANFLVYVGCKELYAHGKMTREQWRQVERRYRL